MVNNRTGKNPVIPEPAPTAPSPAKAVKALGRRNPLAHFPQLAPFSHWQAAEYQNTAIL